MPDEIKNDKNVILIVSDAYGEGSAVAAAASESGETDVTIKKFIPVEKLLKC